MMQSTVFSNPGPDWTISSALAGFALLVVVALLVTAVVLTIAANGMRRRR